MQKTLYLIYSLNKLDKLKHSLDVRKVLNYYKYNE